MQAEGEEFESLILHMALKLREDKVEEFLAALKEHGLFQLSDEGMEYFFEDSFEDTSGYSSVG